METQLYNRYTEHQDEDFIFEVEQYGKVYNLHCRVVNWKLSVLKRMYNVLGNFLNKAKQEGALRVFSVNDDVRFAELLGAKYTSTIVINGEQNEVVEWVLN